MKVYLTVSSFLVASVTLFFLIAVLLKGSRKKRNLAFCFFAVSVFVWSFGHMNWQLSSTRESAVFWLHVLVIGSSFIPYTYLHFVTQVVGQPMPLLVCFGYFVASLLSFLTFKGQVFPRVEERMGFEFWPVAGPAFPLYFGGFLLVVLFSYVLLYSQFRSATTKVRNENKYLILGTALGFCGGATNFPLWLDVQAAPIGHGLSIFYILGIGYSVLKYRLLDFNEMVIRLCGFIAVSLCVGALFSIIYVTVMGTLFTNFFPASFGFWWGIYSLLSFILFIASPRATQFANSLLEAKLAAGRFAYRAELKRISDDVLMDDFDDSFAVEMVEDLHRVLGVDFAGIYIREGVDVNFLPKAVVGERDTLAYLDGALFEGLVQFLAKKRSTIFVGEELELKSACYGSLKKVCDRCPQIRETDVLIPIAAKENFYGFLILGNSSLSGAYADVDLIFLENICDRYGLALRIKELDRMTNQVEKLVSLGTMAAGLSHELRNPLVSIRTLASYLAKAPETPKFTKNFSDTVQRDIRRISGIVEGVSTFAQDSKMPMFPVVLKDAVLEVAGAMQSDLDQAHVKLDIRADDYVQPVLGNSEQLMQVIQNILENAVHAISEWDERPETGHIHVHIYNKNAISAENRRWVEVRFTDNGPGIPKEYQKRVFDPFVTSRDTGIRSGGSGTGLGLAIVQKIVEHHSGYITLSSSKGRGASFMVSLPAFVD